MLDLLRAIVTRVWTGLRPFVWLIIVLAGLTGFWYLLPDYSRVASSSQACPEPVEPTRQPRLATAVAPAPLVLEKPEGVIVNFGRDRGIQSRTVFLQVAKRTLSEGETRYAVLRRDTAFSVSQRPLERQEVDGGIGSARYVAIAGVTARKEIGLTICVDSTQSDVDPGTYVGSVRIASRVIQPVTVPVTVTLQYPGYRWIVPLFAVATFLAGSFVVWASGKRAQKGASTSTAGESVWRDIAELPAWILDNYVGVVAGIIAGISVLVAKYWRSPSWGAKAPEDWLALLGSVFTAYTASLTAASALVPPRGRTRPAPEDQAEPGGTASATASSGSRPGRGREDERPEGESI